MIKNSPRQAIVLEGPGGRTWVSADSQEASKVIAEQEALGQRVVEITTPGKAAEMTRPPAVEGPSDPFSFRR